MQYESNIQLQVTDFDVLTLCMLCTFACFFVVCGFLDGFLKYPAFKIAICGRRASSEVYFWLTFFSKLYVTFILQ